MVKLRLTLKVFQILMFRIKRESCFGVICPIDHFDADSYGLTKSLPRDSKFKIDYPTMVCSVRLYETVVKNKVHVGHNTT